MSDNVVILKDASKAWVTVAERPSDDGEIIVFSPYITGELIEEIVTVSEDKSVLVITSLKAQSVIAGSLDLGLLRKLVEDGVKVFSHENLHAKLLVNGDDTIIGSQNFTTGGTFNLETSVQLELSAKNRSVLNQIINDALADSVKLTTEIIDEYELECAKHQVLLADLHNNLRKIDDTIIKHLEYKKARRAELYSSPDNYQASFSFPATISKRVWKKEKGVKWDIPFGQYLFEIGVSESPQIPDSPWTEELHQHHRIWLEKHSRPHVWESSYHAVKIPSNSRLIDELNLLGGDEVHKFSVIPVFNSTTYQVLFAEIHQTQISKFATWQRVHYHNREYVQLFKVPWNHTKTQSHTRVSRLRSHHPDECEFFSNISLEVQQFPRSGLTSFKLHYFFDGNALSLQKRVELDPSYIRFTNYELTDLSEEQAFQMLADDIPSIVFGARDDAMDPSNASRYFDTGTKLNLSGALVYGQHPVLTIGKRK